MVSAARDPRDYGAAYDDYWSSAERAGESSGDLERTAARIVASCGTRRTLDVGSGEGALVAALLRHGVDAVGVDVSQVVVARCNARIPGRFFHGSALALPFADDAFETVVSTDCLEHLAPEDVPRALAEMRRVASRFVFLMVATTQDRDQHWHLTVEGRAWWEQRCFEAGLRKHPAYYRLNEYESLNAEGWQVCIPLEKIPDAAAASYPLESLAEERGLHMDMLRDTGERSDAHVMRYQWASGYLKPGDRVLDAACGLGYGSHVMANLAPLQGVTGIDGSEGAIAYARACYGEGERVRFEAGLLPQVLAAYPEGSFDAIVSFETLEHVEDPEAVIAAFARLLTPAGRLIVSVPNDWSDETGRDPNPYHLHVYDWERLHGQLAGPLIVEEAYAQTASQAKAPRLGKNVWERRNRSLKPVPLRAASRPECEWWLMTAMKSPLGARLPYREGPFANVAGTRHPAVDFAAAFDNPWLVHAMLNRSYRLRDAVALESLARAVMAEAPPRSNDYAAALCVVAYRALEAGAGGERLDELLRDIEACIAQPPPPPMGLRWQVSLLYVEARLLQHAGRLEEACAAYQRCAAHDVRPFAVHLATKTTESWFMAGKLAHALGRGHEAAGLWRRGVEAGNTLLEVPLEAILIDAEFPNRFNHGDGVREYTLAWDNVARCANGLHLLRLGRPFDDAALESSFQHEYAVVTRDLLEARGELRGRTQLLERYVFDMPQLTADLVEARELLAERTARLETATGELVERTAMLERAGADIHGRDADLIATRELLRERTEALERASALLVERTAALESLRRDGESSRREEEAALAEALERAGRAEAEARASAAELERIARAPLAHALRTLARKLIN